MNTTEQAKDPNAMETRDVQPGNRLGLEVATGIRAGGQECEDIIRRMDELIIGLQVLRGDMYKMSQQM